MNRKLWTYILLDINFCLKTWGRRGRDRMVVYLQLLMQSVPITTDVVSSNLDQGEVYNIMW
jgi:hypothetical protein